MKKGERVNYCFKYGGNCKFCPRDRICNYEEEKEKRYEKIKKRNFKNEKD